MKNIDKLEKEFKAECEDIAALCEEEGYPAYGANYDLRVQNLMETEYYAPLFERK